MDSSETKYLPADVAGSELMVTVEKLVYGGSGLARTDGRVVLAPFVLPGEKAVVITRRAKAGLIQADLSEVLEASPHRASAECPYFGRCGGCAYQHMTYEYQVEQKREVLRDVLQRVGKITPPVEIETVAGPPVAYRNRSQFHLQGGRIGFLEAGSHNLCPVDQCPISSPVINAALHELTAMSGDRRFPHFVRSIELFTNETDIQINVRETERPVARAFFDWCRERIPGFVAGALDYPAGNDLFRVGGRSFFQVNRFLIEQLLEAAIGGASGGTVIDLYAGVGFFSIPLTRRFRNVIAVESGVSALRDLDFNATRAAVNVGSRHQTAEAFLPEVQQPPDLVLADPPRAGLGKHVTAELLRIRPRAITIVSCDPATLARDLAVLTSSQYRIERIVMVDLFPQTFHLETVVHLQARQ